MKILHIIDGFKLGGIETQAIEIIDNFPNLTYIIIAHRLSTLTDCDLLIHIKDGGIFNIDKPNEIIPDLSK